MAEGRRYAIIVGVSSYDDDQISSLKYTTNDATRLADLLVRHCRFEKSRVYLLCNDKKDDGVPGVTSEKPTRACLLHKIKFVADSATTDDLILLFFAGHGAEVSKSPYLLTTDTKLDVLQQTAINVSDLNQMLESSKARCVIRIFDACRSPFAEARSTIGRMSDGLQCAMLKAATGWASFSACSSGEIAHESGELNQGVFSHYLCEGIQGKAANESGDVTFDRLVDYVKTSVGNWSDEQSRKQTPHVLSDLSGALVLATIRKTHSKDSDLANPLELLRTGIDNHLTKISDDSRHLTYTNEDEGAEVLSLTKSSLTALTQNFSHPAYRIEVEEWDKKIITNPDGSLDGNLTRVMREKKVYQDSKGVVSATKCRFTSSEVVLPRTILSIAIVRFSYFYWIWYKHGYYDTPPGFTAEPTRAIGFLTLKPKTAIDNLTIENSIREILKRASEDILTWAEQLRKFVDERLAPLR